MRTLILGGDGFCGWPTSLHLSACGHEVAIVDNLARRNADIELEAESLTPIAPIGTRLAAWREVTGREIPFYRLNVAAGLPGAARPADRVAARRGRPFRRAARRAVLDEELVAQALHGQQQRQRDPQPAGRAGRGASSTSHVVHLGTMGVYGYGTAGVKIPEGYLRVRIDTDDGSEIEQEILYPVNPGSVYHMTKTQDQLLFAYYNKNDGIRVTDLHQGIVWGTQTAETRLDDRLINRFDYDGDYGTVLNRFLMQAAVGYPLTVHGTGGQTRAFIHIQDTVRCIQLAIENPPEPGERVRVFNQMTETPPRSRARQARHPA